MNAGGDVELVVDKLGWQQIFSHFGELTRYGADIDINEVASHLSPLKRLDELDTLVEYGAVIDIDRIVDELNTVQDENVEKLLSNGADAEAVAKKIAPSSMTVENYGLLASSVEDPMGIVDLVNAKNSNELDDLFGLLLDLDVSPDTLMSSDKFPDDTAERYVNDILANGGDVVALAERISPRAVLDNLDLLIEHDAPIDVGKIIDANTGDRLVSRVDWLLDNGADVSELVAKLSSEGIDETFDTLLKHGADINDLVRGLDEDATCKRFGMLMALGADIDLILQNLSEDTARQHAGELLGQGVNIDSILQRIPNIDISEIQSVHDGLGASYASLVPKLSDKDGKKGIDVLLEHSDEVDFQSIVSGLDPNTVLDNFRRIQEKGVTLSLEEIVSKSSGPAILKNIDMIKEAGITIDINKIVSNLHPSLVFDHIETLLDNGADPRLVLERYPEKVLFFTRPDPKILKSKSAALRRAREAAGSAT